MSYVGEHALRKSPEPHAETAIWGEGGDATARAEGGATKLFGRRLSKPEMGRFPELADWAFEQGVKCATSPEPREHKTSEHCSRTAQVHPL